MCKVGLPGLKLLGRGDRLVEAHVRWMWSRAQGIQDEYVESSQLIETSGGNVVRIGAVSDISDSESEDLKSRTMLHPNRNKSSSQDVERNRRNPLEGQFWHGSWVSRFEVGERVVE